MKKALTAMIGTTHHMPLAWDFTMTNPHHEDWLGLQGQPLENNTYSGGIHRVCNVEAKIATAISGRNRGDQF
jgi:hypothetical protein